MSGVSTVIESQQSEAGKGLPPERTGHQRMGEAVDGKAEIISGLGAMECFNRLLVPFSVCNAAKAGEILASLMSPIRICFLFLALLCGSLCPTTAAEDRPNIVWIIPDDMSAHFSCYGETAIETPHVDRLAARGAKFTNAYVTATWRYTWTNSRAPEPIQPTRKGSRTTSP